MVCWGIASRGSSSPFGAKCIRANDSYGSIAASHLRSCFVGLPDKFHFKPFDRLPMPSRPQAIPLHSTDLGADRTPDLARLMLLSNLLF
jgi:hypothetical protein